jgi:ATP-citrate lyase beta-subunit
MAQRAIREFDGKALFAKAWDNYFGDAFEYAFKSALVTSGDELKTKAKEAKWLESDALVSKPDMLFGKRGVNGLVQFKVSKPGDVKLSDATKWIDEKRSGTTTLHTGQSGELSHFIVEPFVPHDDSQEYYIAAATGDETDSLFMSAHGGIEVEENWDKVSEVKVPVDATDEQIADLIRKSVPADVADKERFGEFAVRFYRFFRDYHFAYLEINPIVMVENKVYLLDLVARLDDTAGYLMTKAWGDIDFPTAFGMAALSPEEKAIKQADEKSGASLKLTILNPKGRVWTMVAGGGASVVYADTIADLIGVDELSNYGEYSGNPTTDETRFYAETVIDLMTREKHESGKGKIMLIGGAIANFTDVAKTFTGIIQAFEKMADKMKAVDTTIYVRRGGPNYETGLKNIKAAAERLGLPIEVYGPETHVTDIVRMALENK